MTPALELALYRTCWVPRISAPLDKRGEQGDALFGGLELFRGVRSIQSSVSCSIFFNSLLTSSSISSLVFPSILA
jgi:hypothetical protein